YGYTAVVTGHTARPATATSATGLAWRQARAASRRTMVAQPLVAAERGTLLQDRSPPGWRLLLAIPGQPATMVPAWFFLATSRRLNRPTAQAPPMPPCRCR